MNSTILTPAGRLKRNRALSPNPVVPTPAMPAAVEPGPSRPTDPPWFIGRACYDHGNVSETAPASHDADALALLVEARGKDRLIADLTGGLRWCDRLIREALQALQSPHGRAEAIRRLARLTADRSLYGERLLALGGDPPAEVPIPLALIRHLGPSDPVPEIARSMQARRVELDDIDRQLKVLGQVAADDASYFAASIPPGDRIGEALAECRERLRLAMGPQAWDYIRSAREWSKIRESTPYPERGCQDNLLSQISDLLRRRLEATEQLAGLEQDKATVIALVAARVKSAVEGAGGASALTAAVHSAMTLIEGVSVRPAELDLVEQDLARLAAGGVTEGDAVEALSARQHELLQEAESARADSARARKAGAVELVRESLAGTESARAELERLARQVPRAFPPGFGDRLAGARFDLAVIAELSAMSR